MIFWKLEINSIPKKTQQIMILSKTTQILEKTISSGCNLETKQFSSSSHLLISSSPHPLISSSSKSHTSWKKTGGRRPSVGGPQSIIYEFLKIRNKTVPPISSSPHLQNLIHHRKKTGGRRPSGGGPQSIIHEFFGIQEEKVPSIPTIPFG